MAREVKFTDGSSVSETTTTYQIASCGQCDWIGTQQYDFFSALSELSLHVFQSHMPVKQVAAKTITIEPHEFVGRFDRPCETCGRPDRNPIHN